MHTASLVNLLGSQATIGQPEPFVGMPVTLLGWTDRNAGTVVDIVTSDKTQRVIEFSVTHDLAVRTDKNGLSEDQSYEYTPVPDGHRTVFKLDPKGQWRKTRLNDKGRRVFTESKQMVVLGRRETYRDPSF